MGDIVLPGFIAMFVVATLLVVAIMLLIGWLV